MSTALLIILLGAVRWTAGHSIYGKDPGRFRSGIWWNRRMIGQYYGRNMPYSYPRYYHRKLSRHPYEEWRPVRESPAYGRHIPPQMPPSRYPVYHSKGYSYAPSKNILNQQLAQNSDTIEVFSPAPPSILGYFGHATVKSREPLSHVIKKSPRPQYTADYPNYERPKMNAYQVRNQFVSPTNFYHQHEPPKRPNRFNDYNDPYFFESTLRPPPRDSINKVSNYAPHGQSTSISPNAFYFEQPQPFQPSAVDSSFEKVRKPINSYHYSHPPSYSTPRPINDYEQPAGTYFNTFNKKGNQGSSVWDRNPFGDINLGTRRPEVHIKPVVEEKEPAKDIYNKYSHLSRPFQSSQYTTTSDNDREVDTFSPFVTTYQSPVETHNVKFSDVAKPFQVNNGFRSQVVSINHADYEVTQDPYSQDMYPITVTTVDAPTEPPRDTKKKHKDEYRNESRLPSSRPIKEKKNKYETYTSNRRPQVQITSYQGYDEHSSPPFLPTPTPNGHPYAPQPDLDEITTDKPEVSSNAQDFNYISTIDNKYRDKVEDATDYPVTTTAAIETTTPSPRTSPTVKSRRRPMRPSQMTKTSEYKNHRVPEDDYSTTVDYYKYQRRRKPSNKFRENSDYKRFRTTTTSSSTTTPPPSLFDTTEPYEDTTTVSEGPKVVLGRPQDNGFNTFEQYYSSFIPEVKPSIENVFSSQSPEGDIYNLNYADIFAETTTPTSTTPSTTTSTTTTTTTTTTPVPVSVTTPNLDSASSSIPSRLKNKYGNNRPRFSVKDYRERLKASTTTAATNINEDETTPKPRNDIPKILSRMRPSHQVRSTTEVPTSQEDEGTPEPKYKKYKPRVGPSRTFYKTSTTTQAEPSDTTTTERVNTFRPSTNRYKPGTGKYYSRYRTSTLSPKELDDSPVTTPKVTIKPKGVFSAKRRPHPMKSRPEFPKEDETSDEIPSTPNFGDTLKINDNEVQHGVLSKKIDDGHTTTISSKEKNASQGLEDPTPSTSILPNIPPTGSEAMRVADLTSSSSNDFHSSSIFKSSTGNRRIIPKISLPTEEPILPLEAFFQTRNKD